MGICRVFSSDISTGVAWRAWAGGKKKKKKKAKRKRPHAHAHYDGGAPGGEGAEGTVLGGVKQVYCRGVMSSSQKT